mgnify:CR=1 FL=1
MRKEERPLISKQKKQASPANSVVEQTQRLVSSNSQDKCLVLHVSTVKIGDLVGKTTAPVKVSELVISEFPQSTLQSESNCESFAKVIGNRLSNSNQ